MAWTGVIWDIPRITMLLWAMLNGLLLFGGMFILQAVICFFSIESTEVVNAVSYGGVYVAGYPMEIYGKWFRRLFTYAVPLAAVVYYPVCFILGKGALMPLAAFLIPLTGTCFFGLAALFFYKVGLPNYTSTGT
jgi:ABC-2 type transport system permease protein